MKAIPIFGGGVSMVDECDFEHLSQFKWYAVRAPHTTYAHRYLGDRKYLLMHREIMGDSGLLLDHVNNDGLDNRRSNLRFANSQKNAFNRRKDRDARSRFKGVCFDKGMTRKKRWRASIRKDDKPIYLGYFYTEREAALAYDTAAQSLFGAFAKTNQMLGVL